MAQPSEIRLKKQPQISNAILQHGDALDAHTKGKTLVLSWVNAAVLQYIGVHHSTAQNLEPFFLTFVVGPQNVHLS